MQKRLFQPGATQRHIGIAGSALIKVISHPLARFRRRRCWPQFLDPIHRHLIHMTVQRIGPACLFGGDLPVKQDVRIPVLDQNLAQGQTKGFRLQPKIHPNARQFQRLIVQVARVEAEVGKLQLPDQFREPPVLDPAQMGAPLHRT